MPRGKTDKPRPPNPVCTACRHAFTFHSRRDPKSHRRACRAFGCACKNFVKPGKVAA